MIWRGRRTYKQATPPGFVVGYRRGIGGDQAEGGGLGQDAGFELVVPDEERITRNHGPIVWWRSGMSTGLSGSRNGWRETGIKMKGASTRYAVASPLTTPYMKFRVCKDRFEDHFDHFPGLR